MNDDRRPTDWPDDRLAGAFAARADARPTPSDLSAATIDRIRRVPRIAPTRDRFVRLGGLVAAAAAVAVVAVALVARPPAGPIGSAGPTTFGLPVVSVAEAIAIRDGGVDDREIAVHGFLATFGPMPCPPPTTDFTTLNNPTRLWCESAFTWVMEQPEVLVYRTSTSVSGRPPSGPALKPGLALVDTAGLSLVGDSDVPTAVVFIGHFDDRRADFCPADVRSTCADTFIVDRIDRGTLATVTVKDLAQPDQPVQADSEIDSLVKRVDPSLLVLSRRVVAIEQLASTEPVYAVPAGGTPSYVSSAAWLVTALPRIDASGRTVARTFVIFDGTGSINEITRNGPVQVSLGEAPSPSPVSTTTTTPSLSPTPTVSPTPTGQADLSTLLTAPITVSQAIDHRDNHLDDTELAVSGYYVVPNYMLDCAVDLSSPISPHCEDRVTWLVEQQPTDRATTIGASPPPGPKLNLVIRAGVAFDLDSSIPAFSVRDVVALGHFDDRRAETCIGVMTCRLEFVVDRVEDASGSMPLARVVRMTQSAKEDPAAVTARVLRAAGPVQDSWLVVVDGSTLPSIEPDVIKYAADLTGARVVWIAHRLVNEGGRLVARSAYTADGSDRIWAETGDHGFERLTTIEVPLVNVAGSRGVIVWLVDEAGTLVSARSATADEQNHDHRTWITRVEPDGVGAIEVAAGDSATELAIRWTGSICDTTWQLNVTKTPGIVLSQGLRPPCDALGIGREILVKFDRPVDPATVQVSSAPEGG